MQKHEAYKFRLKLNHQQIAQCMTYAGCARFVWNKALALNKFRLENKHYILRYSELDFWTKLWKQSEDYSFLRECPSQVFQQKLRDLDKAFSDCFNKSSPKRFPRFKKKGEQDSVRIPQGFKLKGQQIFLPKLGWLRMRASRPVQGTVKNITLSRQGQHWFVALQTEREVATPVHPSQSMIGIDLGIKRFATLSDGRFTEPANSLKTALNSLYLSTNAHCRAKLNFLPIGKNRTERLSSSIDALLIFRVNFLHLVSHQLKR